MKNLHKLLLLFVTALLWGVLVACNTAASDEPSAETDSSATEEHTDDDHDHPEGRISNDGAIIRLISPADGATFKSSDEIKVEVEVENFELGTDGHWHILVDGTEWSMIMSSATNDTLRGLSPGEHEIEVTLSNNDHQDLEDGDHAVITIEE